MRRTTTNRYGNFRITEMVAIGVAIIGNGAMGALIGIITISVIGNITCRPGTSQGSVIGITITITIGIAVIFHGRCDIAIVIIAIRAVPYIAPGLGAGGQLYAKVTKTIGIIIPVKGCRFGATASSINSSTVFTPIVESKLSAAVARS